LIFLCSLCLPPSSTLLPYTTLFRSLIGGNPHDGGLPVDQSFLLHLDREADGGKPRALAVAGLKHKELSILDGELEILDVSEMVLDRKSTRLNSSHQIISYAVFCLKK